MRRLFTWMMLAFAAVVLLSTLARTISLQVSLQRTLRGATTREAMADARAIALWVETRWDRPAGELRPSLGALARVAGARIWLVGRDGTVRVDTQGNPSWEGAAIAAGELDRALAGQESVVTGRSPWLESAVACIVPVVRDGAVVGAVFLFLPAGDVAAAADRLAGPLASSAGVALLVAAVAAYLISRSLARPVEQITRFARSLGRGEFGGQLQVRTVAEVNELAATLTQVSGQLRASFAALGQERQRLAAILESMHEGVLAVDGEGQVTLANPAALRLLRWEPPPALPVPLAGAPLPARLRRALLAAAGGEGQEVPLRPRSRDDLLAACLPVPGPDGRDGAVAVIRDLSAVMRLQRLRENLVADVTHELRGPLTNLSVITEALSDGTIRRRNREQYLQVLQAEVARLRRLSSDVLDLARMDAGMVEATPEPVDLAAVAEAVAGRMGSRAAAAGVALVAAVPPGMAALASRDRMEQVVFNLVENALRHTPAGGTVTIAAAREDGRVRLTVTDSGTGIPAEHLPHVFERFHKVDPARTRTDAGTGLGLAVVKQLVELQGGSVEAVSEEGKGSTFSVVLPAA